MKTLLTTIAVLFTMATTASADERHTNELRKYTSLTTCMLGAQITGIAEDTGMTYNEVWTNTAAPENNEQLVELIEEGNDISSFIFGRYWMGQKYAQVLELVTGVRGDEYDAYMTTCVSKYYGIEA